MLICVLSLFCLTACPSGTQDTNNPEIIDLATYFDSYIDLLHFLEIICDKCGTTKDDRKKYSSEKSDNKLTDF